MTQASSREIIIVKVGENWQVRNTILTIEWVEKTAVSLSCEPQNPLVLEVNIDKQYTFSMVLLSAFIQMTVTLLKLKNNKTKFYPLVLKTTKSRLIHPTE